jgi:[acyl-carrier-protein] S-malonyltransferase
MTKTAFLFPGQGSQQKGMGKAACQAFPQAQDVFDIADRALGFSLSKLCFEGPEDELQLTENTQPAILATSIALYRVLSARGLEPDFVAGHSLGEYSALVAAGSLQLEDAVVLVRKRGRYMQEAVPVGQGAMAAILGLSAEKVRELCRQAAQGEVVEPANFNGAGQVVIAGQAAAVKRASDMAKGCGARRAIALPVSAPFHCRLMKPAAENLAGDLRETAFTDLRIPLVTNVDAQGIRRGDEARDALERQVTAPVRWEESVQKLIEDGVTRFVEVGAGKVLSGLVRKIHRGASVASVGEPEEVDELFGEMTSG